MITQEELDYFLNEFHNEDAALVNEALVECIKLHGRSLWNTASDNFQITSIFCWLAGWKHRDAASSTISESGWGGKWATGGTVTVPLGITKADQEKHVVSNGYILVTDSQFKLLGAQFLRNLNCTPNAEIIVIPDDKYNDMSPAERIEYLNDVVTKDE
ncbi:MAG: hypothetical protein DRO67_06425 [Candidatus Asgardarchaeum californiense]|nr:MAG: hypothetical protein DRO67_06425 [Candidatus Asgardarchaeum californiense]